MNDPMNDDHVNDERRDAELDALRDLWQPAAPSEGFHQRVLAAYKQAAYKQAAYQQEFPRDASRGLRPSRMLWLAFAGAVAVCLLIAGIAIGARFRHDQPSAFNGSGRGSAPAAADPYQPVHRPTFVVISEGEQP